MSEAFSLALAVERHEYPNNYDLLEALAEDEAERRAEQAREEEAHP